MGSRARLPQLGLAVLLWVGAALTAAADVPAGRFDADQCVACHTAIQPDLVADWQRSVHAEAGADCTACHGDGHRGAAARARRDATCIDCHGERSPEVHSYTTSKHGVITGLEGPRREWRAPLQDANYRTPGCAYCHMHRADHAAAPTNVSSAQSPGAVCYECHGPRYVGRLFDNGRRMVELGRLKLREGRELLAEHGDALTRGERKQADARLATMDGHLRNLRLGVGHQSPDYQWWHGHPALDGDLLRLKGLVETALRQRRLEGDAPVESSAAVKEHNRIPESQ